MTLEQYQNGHIFLIDKPLNWTSFDAVNKIKWRIKKHFNIKKIKVGHAGTLDPKATGLLIVCTGKFTKNIQEIQDASKVYTGKIKLGVQTPSYDTETEEYNPKDISFIADELIQNAAKEFEGKIMQRPPVFSALKKDGKRLYEFAREGVEVDIPKREIEIFSFEITSIEMPFVSFKVHCSKGTYIRSLANDLGEKLHCGAYLTELKRTQIGDFSLENADNSILNEEINLFQ